VSGKPSLTAYVVEDDDDMREAVGDLLALSGHDVALYADAARFLEEVPEPRGVLVVDLRLKGMSGLRLQQKVMDNAMLAIIFISGVADIQDSVEAMKAGALDFLVKPVRAQILIDAVAAGMERVSQVHRADARHSAFRAGYEMLTEAEREIAGFVAMGWRNKQIANKTGKTENTVKVHRARMLKKMEAGSPFELMTQLKAIGVLADP